MALYTSLLETQDPAERKVILPIVVLVLWCRDVKGFFKSKPKSLQKGSFVHLTVFIEILGAGVLVHEDVNKRENVVINSMVDKKSSYLKFMAAVLRKLMLRSLKLQIMSIAHPKRDTSDTTTKMAF
ncbi:uncharacterized protein LOC118491723 [Helianthus annuus]|uniref:uncharacterized protein LOC118491723 n=1 Tax=Helianthus annuus TaxID=4232 RepID=UPI0016530F29|nr:uncharacterized protein LOC118491723 [Helianthus annuus]